MWLYSFFFGLMLITVFSTVSSKCSTAAKLEHDMRISTEIPPHNWTLYDGGDILKWNCSDEYEVSLPPISSNNEVLNTYRSSSPSKFNGINYTNSLPLNDSFGKTINETALSFDSQITPKLNTFLLIYNKMFNQKIAENSSVEEATTQSQQHSARASIRNDVVETRSELRKDSDVTSRDLIVSYVETQNSYSSNKISNFQSVKLLLGGKDGVTILDGTHLNQSVAFHKENLTAYDVDYDYKEGILVFIGQGQLRSTQEPMVLASNGVDGPVRISVDWIHNTVYWMADKYQTVERASLNGDHRIMLSNSFKNFSYPNNIVVDPHERCIFLVGNHNIYKATLDFTDLEEITFHDNVQKGVRCIAIDRQSKRIYFTGKVGSLSGKPYIASTDYKGGIVSFYNLSKEIWSDIYSLDVFGNVLYFAHHEPEAPDSLWKLNISQSDSTPEKIYSASEVNEGMYKIRVFDAGVQKENCNSQ